MTVFVAVSGNFVLLIMTKFWESWFVFNWRGGVLLLPWGRHLGLCWTYPQHLSFWRHELCEWYRGFYLGDVRNRSRPPQRRWTVRSLYWLLSPEWRRCLGLRCDKADGLQSRRVPRLSPAGAKAALLHQPRSSSGKISVVGFEVLTVVIMKSIIFWDITPYSTLSVNRCFGGTYRLHLQGIVTCFHTGFLFSLFFDHEDRGDMFLRNVGWHSMDYTAL
jgi:hypothetical protein